LLLFFKKEALSFLKKETKNFNDSRSRDKTGAQYDTQQSRGGWPMPAARRQPSRLRMVGERLQLGLHFSKYLFGRTDAAGINVSDGS